MDAPLFVSTRGGVPAVHLSEAIARGLAADGGLYVPRVMPALDLRELHGLTRLPALAAVSLRGFFTGDRLQAALGDIAGAALDLAAPTTAVVGCPDPLFALELFHGPTAAFKDFGARFLAESLQRLEGGAAQPLTILVATSGDTGGAVAAAFHRRPWVRIVILYPKGLVSPRQEQQLTCWGDNVVSLRIDGSFDDCQRLVKEAFVDAELNRRHRFSSANSINVGRLLPQMSYYVASSLDVQRRTGLAASYIIPAGNLGNAFAAVWARELGLPIDRIVLAHNRNHAVPDYIASGVWQPRPSVPTLLAMTDGRWAVAGMDRNALRPLRYTRTSDGLLIVGSESGMVVVPESTIVAKGRLGPGQMIAVDLDEGIVLEDRAVKDRIAGEADYAAMTGAFLTIDDLPAVDSVMRYDRADLARRQVAAGQTLEDMELILSPMVEAGKEAIGSMGDDTPLAVISDKPRLISQFFRQNFSQVTNPPIDSLRERHVMSLKTRFGNLANILDTEDRRTRVLVLDSPVLTCAAWERLKTHFGSAVAEIDCTFDAGAKNPGGPERLRAAIQRIRNEAEQAVRQGKSELFLTDEGVSEDRVAIAGVLAAAAVHTHLVRKGLRSYASINVRSAECLDTHYYAVLIGVGATTVNAYLAEASIADRHARGLFGALSLDQCLARHRTAIEEGLLKIISKMGIAVISSYRGGYNFEAVGLSRALVNDLFPGMPAKISGEGYASLHLNATLRHDLAFDSSVVTLPIGGFYRQRAGSETHAYSAQLMHLLQTAVATDSYSSYLQFSRGVADLPPVYLRDLMQFNFPAEGVAVDQVEAITEIRKRFVTPGMSLGALSPEAHETLAIAMNRIGAKAVSGEGGEARERYTPYANGDNANSGVKQIASGRFGVTAEYLNACEEIEIKVAQGAKPGEGGQLPGFKVTEFIAKLRHATPGVTLISPPPHHDIYSIEDLAQLIYDLKQINPRARVCVKLVSSAGIGTVAAGVAKAHADVILVAGHVGGTGASPQTSIKYAGTPWEMGLSEVNQTLTLNGLRGRIRLRADGGLKTGRDIVIAAILGAEEFGIGTLSLVAMGCIMVRQCHSNTCPVGVCTQDERLRAKFVGTPEKVINLMTFIAEEVRDILARLGFRSLDEVIGRTELLRQVSRGAEHLDDLDLNPILAKVDADDSERRFSLSTFRNEVPDSLDAQIIKDAAAVFSRGEKMQLTYSVRNTHRAVGTRLSSEITRTFGMSKLADGHVTVRLRGAAGQSLGAFLCKGITLEVFGDANDYVGKGLSGGIIIVRPAVSSPLASQDNTIVGNTVLYGATSGSLFAAGQAGRTVRGTQFGRDRGRRGLRRERLRIYDQWRGGRAGQGRREFRRWHDRRNGVRLRSRRRVRSPREWREHRLATIVVRALGRRAARAGRTPRRRDRQQMVQGSAGGLGPRRRAFLAGGAQGNADPAGAPARRYGRTGRGGVGLAGGTARA